MHLRIHTAGNACVENGVRLERVDERLRANRSVDLSDTAANVYDTSVPHLIEIIVKSSFFLNFRVRQTLADIHQF